jgi:hypothetical protein
MPGKRLFGGLLVLSALAASGCCEWCRRHYCGTAATAAPACCMPVCCPAPAACQPATTYSAPAAPPPPPQTWQRTYSYAAPSCSCQ